MRSLNNYEDTHRHPPRESEYVKTSNAKFEQLRGYTQGASRPSERFEPRQTTVCRLNPHVPNRKLKPPQMRRFEFSGRDCFINGILHPLQIPDTHEISGNPSQKPPFSAIKTHPCLKLTGNNLIKTRNDPTTSRKHNEKILQNQCTLLDHQQSTILFIIATLIAPLFFNHTKPNFTPNKAIFLHNFTKIEHRFLATLFY